MDRSAALLALLVGLLIVPTGAIAAGVTAGNQSGNQSGNASAPAEPVTGESGYTVSELRENGPQLGNSPPGVRMGTEMVYWVVHWEANDPFADVGADDSGEPLSPDTTVGRNSVYIRTWTYESRQETVKVVYWQEGEKKVTRGNTTTTETVPVNVTEETHEVTFERGRPTVEIPLRQHDETVHVAMWIDGKGWARWTFDHKSVATTQAVSIGSAGEYLKNVILDFLLVIVLGGFVVGLLAKKALDRAGIGPQWGYLPWIVALSLALGAGSLFAYRSLADLVVNAKYVLALFVVGIFGIILLETYTSNVAKALFIRPTLEYAESPTGDSAFDIVDMEVKSEKLVRTNVSDVSVVTPGLLPFLARVFGRSAVLENVEKLRTRLPVKGSKWDEIYVVDPEADELLEYDKEGFGVNLPPLDRTHAASWLAALTGLGTAAYSLEHGIGNPWLVGGAAVVGALVWAISPKDGRARVDPAPVHLRTAFGSMLSLEEDVDNAKRFDELKTKLDQERVRKQREVDREVAEHDSTLIQEMLDPAENVPAAVESDQWGDEEITENGRENAAGTADPEVSDD